MKIALFDFDETLVEENSLGFLFKHFLGKTPLPLQLLPLLLKPSTYKQPVKTSIKTHFYKQSLNGKTSAEVFAAGESLFQKVTPIDEVVNMMTALHDSGMQVWIVTASPEQYIAGIVKQLGWPVERVIGTTILEKNGCFTGDIDSECQEQEKVRRLDAIFNDSSITFQVEQAFGNLPVDIPMLKMAKKRFYVLDSIVKPYEKSE
ncbi:HAD-IB family hydrolase [Moritella marina]|uniref:HAD-IB family hydrolase n=1 Tax=Moritella marina TaxID=90736 RepID=UPI0037048439